MGTEKRFKWKCGFHTYSKLKEKASVLVRKNKVGRIIIFDNKAYCRATAIKTV